MFRLTQARLLITASSPEELSRKAGLPQAADYRKLSVKELIALIETRETQISQIRTIYEGMLYNSEQTFRKQMLDHDDQRHSLGKMHSKVVTAAKTNAFVTIKAMRMDEERHRREKAAVVTICVIGTLIFWFWVRKHYQDRFLLQDPSIHFMKGLRTAERDYFYRTMKWSAKSWETAYDTEVRERQEKEAAAAKAAPNSAS
jgi:hypothetical protein